MKRFFIIILIIFLPLYSLLKSVEINTFNKNLYLKSYDKYNITEITGKSMDELDNITQVIFQYLKEGLKGQVLEPYFNSREIAHMEDVKYLFKYGFILKYVSFVLSLLSIMMIFIYKIGKSIGKGLFYGIFIWWGFFLLLFLLSLMDFTKYFTYFHLIFFNNDLWLLDPKTDLLIQMLPEEFFIEIFKRIALLFMSFLAIIQTIGLILMRKVKNCNGRTFRF